MPKATKTPHELELRRVRWNHTWMGGVITALVGLFCWFLSLPRDLTPLESSSGGRLILRTVNLLGLDPVRLSYDWSYTLSPDLRPTNVVVVYVDDNTYSTLTPRQTQTDGNGKELDRKYYAEAIRKLKQFGARTIALDFWYDPNRNSTPSDRLLAEAVAEHGKVVVGIHTAQTIHNDVRGQNSLRPLEALIKAGARLGNPTVLHSGDRLVRSFRNGTADDPGFAWICAQVAGFVPEHAAPTEITSYINYYCRPSELQHANLSDLLDPKNQVPDFYKDRYVFIGSLPFNQVPLAQSRVDEFRAPHEDRVAGVAIWAMAFLNIVNGDGLRRMSEFYEFLLLMMGGGLIGAAWVWLRPGWATAISLLTFLMVFAISSMLVWRTHVFWGWMFMAGFQVPVALIWSVITCQRRLKREKEELQFTLTETLKEVEDTRSRAKAAAEAAAEKGSSLAEPDGKPQAVGQPTPGPLPASPASADSPPSELADHALIRRVGKGGYGEVWLAMNAVGLYHVIKLVYRQEFRDAGPYEREFRGIQRFMPISRSHPGFVHILHVGRSEERGMFFCVMEAGDDEKTGAEIHPDTYTPKTLAGELRARGALPVKECLSLGIALASALEKLHQQNLIHRDIKPSNIIYVMGQPKLADIGLVTEVQSTAHDVSHLGTDGFIAPEGPGTPASDVYSLGKVLYEACMGLDRRRFPELPTALYDSPDAGQRTRLNRVILQACEPSPEDRYADATAMKADLEKLLSDLGLPKQ